MKILILTIKGHIYGNFILKKLLFEYFPDDIFAIFESTVLLPSHSDSKALRKYLKISGWYYVISQVFKVYAFHLLWLIGRILHVKKIGSSFVYWKSLNNSYLKGVKSFDVDNIKSSRTLKLAEWIKPDLLISLYFNQIIPQSITSLPSLGAYNIHPAKLPEYKGISPIFWVLAENRRDTGITIHEITQKIDEGNIVSQAEVSIGKNDSEHTLYARCTIIGLELLKDLILNLKKEIYPDETSSEIGGFYRSIPTKGAVKNFRRRGAKFFRFGELVKNFDQL